ncbi:MAG: 4Fe-4S dicluster domain-containing protein [Myxococcales bacterium]|nr:MAG: 4Fe-4S dicluster domain-containing protein [Myxococcales bacterium]
MSDAAIAPEGASKKLHRDLRRAGTDVWACYQCGRCSAGCPLSGFFDLLPMEVIRLAAYGAEETLLNSRSIWLCASCETCTTRCPNDIDIARTMDVLRERALDRGYSPAEPRVAAFHKAFLNSVRQYGRTFELGMIGAYKLSSGDMLGDFKLGLKLLARGKLRLLPSSIRGKAEVRRIFRRSRKEG